MRGMRSFTFALMLFLTGVACMAPVMAQVVQVLPPPWAYQINVGMRLGELRTVSGRQYTRVRVEALDNQRIQFTHSQGRSIEWLVSIVDPKTYANSPAPQNGAGGRVAAGSLAAMMTAQNRVATGVDKLDELEQLTLKNWLGQGRAPFPTANNGMHKLDPREKAAMERWLDQKRIEMNPGLAAQPPGPPIQLPVNSWISAQDFTGFQQGRVFNLGNGQSWQQTDQTNQRFSRQVSGGVIKVHIHAEGGLYRMSIHGAGQIFVKPYR